MADKQKIAFVASEVDVAHRACHADGAVWLGFARRGGCHRRTGGDGFMLQPPRDPTFECAGL